MRKEAGLAPFNTVPYGGQIASLRGKRRRLDLSKEPSTYNHNHHLSGIELFRKSGKSKSGKGCDAAPAAAGPAGPAKDDGAPAGLNPEGVMGPWLNGGDTWGPNSESHQTSAQGSSCSG